VEAQLKLLKQEFEGYFSVLIDAELPEWKVTRYPFRLNEEILLHHFLEKHSSTAKDDFEAMPLTDFWVKYVHV